MSEPIDSQSKYIIERIFSKEDMNELYDILCGDKAEKRKWTPFTGEYAEESRLAKLFKRLSEERNDERIFYEWDYKNEWSKDSSKHFIVIENEIYLLGKFDSEFEVGFKYVNRQSLFDEGEASVSKVEWCEEHDIVIYCLNYLWDPISKYICFYGNKGKKADVIEKEWIENIKSIPLIISDEANNDDDDDWWD